MIFSQLIRCEVGCVAVSEKIKEIFMAGKRDSLKYAIGRVRLSGSFKTVANHKQEAVRFVGTLRELGYGVSRWDNVSNLHVGAVVESWKAEGLSLATIKEYLSGVRAVALAYGNTKINSQNSAFGLGRRVYVNNLDKALPDGVYSAAVESLRRGNEDQQRVAAQLVLMRELGLRHEEARKFNPQKSLLKDGRLYICAGTKGGRDRMLHNPSGKQLDAARAVAKFIGKYGNSMPNGMSEKRWESYVYKQVAALGISRKACGVSLHGLRHAYAQARYKELTGFSPPCCFPNIKAYMLETVSICGQEWRNVHRDAVSILARELGHNRDSVVSIYIGSCN